ncbi:hypothetical protein Gogos_008659 [Gossypium gossypioides]|uniref:Uncharacterized protein n=1 Tax=Gossypium gossypioides TaxID=34282 RepID=A0A7J9CCJ4_GOSGO|nr:hypothetical protein [Gossypium gossypioides]
MDCTKEPAIDAHIVDILCSFGVIRPDKIGIVQEYVKDFSELMLQISDLSVKEIFYWFKDGLKQWAKQKLHRQGIIELTVAMDETKSFTKLGGRKLDKSESIKPNSNQREMVGETKTSHPRMTMGHKRKGLMFVDIIVTRKRLNTLIDTGASDLFISKKIAKKLGLRVEKELGWIKTMNSMRVSIMGVVKGVGSNNALLVPFADCMCILDSRHQCVVSIKCEASA